MSEDIEKIIIESIKNFKSDKLHSDCPFEEILSMGELVDRLSIVNLKLYKLKDDVMLKENDNEFKSWASVEDVKLVKERARLKRCIDAKLISVINKISNGDSSGGFNPEVKKYG